MCVHQVPVNPSLYLIKYDGFDCVYGLELHKDERVQGLEVLPDRLGKTELKTRLYWFNTVVKERYVVVISSSLVLGSFILYSVL